MKRLSMLMAALALPCASFAFDGTSVPQAMVYWKMPLDPRSGATRPSFGLRLNGPVAAASASAFPGHERTPPLDIAFTRDGLAGIYVRGLNLAPRGALRVNGESAPAEVSPVAIGLVALGVVVVIAAGSKDDKKEEPACPAIFPPPPGCAAPQ